MNKPVRLVLAAAFPGVVLLLVLLFPQFFLQEIILPAATSLWLVLRIFVLSIGQEVYWWGVIAAAVIGLVLFLAHGTTTSGVAGFFFSAAAWDPARDWRNVILLNIDSEPSQDSLRRDLGWLLSSLYTTSHPGGAPYQVRDALQERQIAIPPGIYDFLFASTLPRGHAPSFFENPRRRVQAALGSLTATARAPLSRRRRETAYERSVDEVLAFLETRLEMTDELDSDARH